MTDQESLDPWGTDPAFKAWVRDVQTNLVPKLESSATVVSLAPPEGRYDAKFAVETGMAILMGKPMMIVVAPGRPIPGKLHLVADEIVYADLGTEEGKRAVHEAVERMHERLGDD